MIFNLDSALMAKIGMSIEPYIKTIGEFKKDKGLSVIKSILKSNLVIWGQSPEKIL